MHHLNILSNIILVHLAENKTAIPIFLTKFCNPCNIYPTNFSAHNFLVTNLEIEKKYKVSITGPFCNSLFTAAERTQESPLNFSTTIKENLYWMTNKTNHFRIESIKVKNQFFSMTTLLKFHDFALENKGLDDKTLMVFCNFASAMIFCYFLPVV